MPESALRCSTGAGSQTALTLLLLCNAGCPDEHVPGTGYETSSTSSGRSTGEVSTTEFPDGSTSGYACDSTSGGTSQDGDSTSAPICGDGVIDPGEQCDDAGETAACNADCTNASCGDGVHNSAAGEECDEGTATATCNEDCSLSVCGDGIVNPAAGEACDDGGETATCDDDCSLPACGDGVLNVTAGETCDDGGDSPTCDADCTFAACGDGYVNTDSGEECDDGGGSASCDVDCTLPVCGDGLLNTLAGEECDDGGRSGSCNLDCTGATCGDGVLNVTAGEDCDDAGFSETCDLDCTPALCGDGVHNPVAGEVCDDGANTLTCDLDCTPASCGDGLVNVVAGETCDDAGDSATCDADCTPTLCGDGVVNAAAGEECDDAGESAACDADCTAATCGDGLVNLTAGEDCDDGNTIDGDECPGDCRTRDCSAISWPWGTEPSVPGAMTYPATWTIEGWFRVPSLPVPDGTGDYGFLVGIDATEQCPGPQHWGVEVHADGRTRGFLGASYEMAPTNATVIPGEWYHFALQNDGDGLGSFWIDGSLAHTLTGGTPTWTTGCPLRIGNSQGSSNHFLGAELASVRFSNVARYAGTFTPDPILFDDAQALWVFQLDEGAGSSAFEESGPLVMQLNGAVWVADGPGC